MGTTTVRVDTETHERLLQLSRASGRSLGETMREATEALRRQRFADRVTDQLGALREDAAAWEEYLREAESTEVDDGIS